MKAAIFVVLCVVVVSVNAAPAPTGDLFAYKAGALLGAKQGLFNAKAGALRAKSDFAGGVIRAKENLFGGRENFQKVVLTKAVIGTGLVLGGLLAQQGK